MNNIYIIGTPRTGKSTFSQILRNEIHQYSLVSTDAIRNAFIKTLPNLDMGNRYGESRNKILPEFIFEFIEWNNKILNNYCIVEGAIFDLRRDKNLFEKNDIVVCLSHGKLSMEEIILNIKKFDNESDYTKEWGSDKIRQHFGDLSLIELENEKICKEFNYLYIDTSINREEVFKNLILEVKNKIT